MRNGNVIAAHLVALAEWLRNHQPLWQPSPLHHPSPAWQHSYPKLADWCASQAEHGPEDAEQAWMDERLPCDAPTELESLLAQSRALTEVPALTEVSALSEADLRPQARPRRIKARKWEQVLGAESVMAAMVAGRRVVDWCGGKGHLGRRLAARGATRQLLLVDHTAALLAAGQADGKKAGLNVNTVCADVLDEANTPLVEALRPDDAMVALHACGDLGARALHLANERGLRVFGHAPCCWVRTNTPNMSGSSAVGRAGGIHLELETLRLATADEGWGPMRRRELRRKALAWRLALDHLVRRQTGSHHYTPIRVVPRSWLDGDFETFVYHAAHHNSLPLPPSWDAEEVQNIGQQAARQVRAQGLVRAPFRRVLELWLVLDRAQVLVEAGWQVEVGTFCSTAATPRNLWMRARR